MLQLVGNTTGRKVIAAIFLQLVLVIVLPASWLHCHDHHSSATGAQSGSVGHIQGIAPDTSFAEDDHCTFCGHTWPGFIVSEQFPVVFYPAFDQQPERFSSQHVPQGQIASKEGRGPPSRA